MIIKQLSPQATVLTGMKTAWNNLSTELIKKGHKIITKSKNYDIAIANTYDPLSLISLLMTKKPKVIHASTTNADLKGTYILLDWAYHFAINYLKFFYSKADRIITISNFAKKCLVDMGIKKRIDVVSCGVNLKKLKYSNKKRLLFRKKYNIKDNEIVVINIGMPTWRKGIDIFISIAKKFPKVKFIWVGGNVPLKKNWFKIRRLIKYKSNNIIFTGYIDDIVSAYCGADIFLFTTRSENEGLPILEAGACKRAIVSTNLPPIREKIKNGYNGFLCNNEEEFIKRLRQLIKSSNLRKRIGFEAYKMARRYDSKKTTARMIKILEEML